MIRIYILSNNYPTPEHIDEGYAPSKRILDLCPSYSKVVDGVIIARDIGLAKIIDECLHFRQWIEKLLILGSANKES